MSSMQDSAVIRKFRIAIYLTSAALVIEIFSGIWSHSLALIADAAHVFTDLFALSLSLAVVYLSQYPPTEKRTYGWHRAEVFVAMINSGTLIFLSLWIIYEAYQRFFNPQDIRPVVMTIAAVAGMVINYIVVRVLGHKHGDEKDLNVKSAYWHVMGDLLSSIGVVAGAVVIWMTKLNIIDPVLSIGISLMIVYNAINILRDSTNILLEGVPRGMKVESIAEDIRKVKEIVNVHDIHVWAICSHITSLSCHIELDEGEHKKSADVVALVIGILKEKYGITHTTIQTECGEMSCKLEEVITNDLEHKGDEHDDED
ncbi:MAG: cation diffusion facilitator family transporter [Elusimicrobiota bacterium]